MQNERVVAVQVSQHKCVDCGQFLGEGALSPHLCPHCKNPQPLSSSDSEDYFEALGIPRRFAIDLLQLENRFYEISRFLHPDRFSISSIEIKNRSLGRMSYLNQAYRTLKDKSLLRGYLLSLEKVEIPKGQAPVELAEIWFEIQDGLTEVTPQESLEKIGEFRKQLEQEQKQVEISINALEKKYDFTPCREFLEEMGQQIQTQNYLDSMKRDVEQVMIRLQTGLKK